MRPPARGAAIALGVLALLGVVAVLGPVAWPVDPDHVFDAPMLVSASPSVAHPLGTDPASRDVLARLIAGARVSLSFGLLAAVVALGLGTLAGLAAALAGPRTDRVIGALIDVGLAVPRLLVLIVLTAALGRLPWAWLAVTMGVTGWFGLARQVRSRARALAAGDFARAARALGAGTRRLALRHVLPNIAGTLSAAAVLAFAHAITLEAALSFIGQGVPIPVASWGGLISDGRAQLWTSPWLALAPTLALVTCVVAAGALADAIERASPWGRVESAP
ncbi:MAG: ABC transporter permease [Gemmatimonadetes bacterium]|nr:ABC transporter permease [Gemmatimonadota bacterium]